MAMLQDRTKDKDKKRASIKTRKKSSQPTHTEIKDIDIIKMVPVKNTLQQVKSKTTKT